MSFLQSPSSTSPVHAAPRSPVASSSGLAPQTVYHEWVVGCGCLLAAVLVVSCNTVLQVIYRSIDILVSLKPHYNLIHRIYARVVSNPSGIDAF